MDDIVRRENPADWELPMPTEAELLAALEESEADPAAGRMVPGEVVRQTLLDSIFGIEAKKRAEQAADLGCIDAGGNPAG